MRWFQHTVPDLTSRWIPTASHPKGMAHFNSGAGGPLPWHLHVISTGSTAGLHTGLIGCSDIDDGGVGQGSHDPAGIAAVGIVYPGRPSSDPVHGAEYDPRAMPRSGRPGTSSCTDGRQGMLLTTTSTLQDRHIDDYKGVVSGEAILGANAFRDMFAGIRDIVGGRSAAYERELQRAKDLADQRNGRASPGHRSQRRHRHRPRLRDRGPKWLNADGNGKRDGRRRDVAQRDAHYRESRKACAPWNVGQFRQSRDLRPLWQWCRP